MITYKILTSTKLMSLTKITLKYSVNKMEYKCKISASFKVQKGLNIKIVLKDILIEN